MKVLVAVLVSAAAIFAAPAAASAAPAIKPLR